MKKPTAYLDTSIISAYWYEGANVSMLSRRLHTQDWWDAERGHFHVWTSAFAETELEAGTFRRQVDCLKMARKLPYLQPTSAVRTLTDAILARRIIPSEKPIDAAHLAMCIAHGLDYLLTWNYAHLANPSVQARMEKLCKELALDSPLLVSPESIPQVRFGQSIRRST